MTDARAITWSVSDGIAVVTLDCPGAPVNTISRDVMAEFNAAFDVLARDQALRAVAFFSGKPENFIAGADIEEFVRLSSAAEAERMSAEGQEMLMRVARFPRPVVVGIHGACLGGGFEFALAAHYRVATDHPKTQIGLPEIQLGILPGAGGCQRLPRLVGRGRALEMILTGEMVDAQEAQRIGLVNKVVPQAELLNGVHALAAKMIANGPVALALAIEAVDHGYNVTTDDALRLESNLFGLLASTSDMREGMSAFLEKRKPEFKGQ